MAVLSSTVWADGQVVPQRQVTVLDDAGIPSAPPGPTSTAATP
ncbi:MULTISPECIES: hypothetical protein [Nocardia]|nr:MULTISPECIES: hypothetical protein [Nocardia]